MNATQKTVIAAALAAALESAIEALSDGPIDWEKVAMRAVIGAVMVCIAYLKQSPVKVTEKPEGK